MNPEHAIDAIRANLQVVYNNLFKASSRDCRGDFRR